MDGGDHRHAVVGQLAEGDYESIGCGRVQPTSRLVEDQNARVGQQLRAYMEERLMIVNVCACCWKLDMLRTYVAPLLLSA